MTTALTAVLCVLYSTCFVAVLSSCDRSGPGSCFKWWPKTCDTWQITSGWSVKNYYSNYYLGRNKNHAMIERVKSRKACSTNNTVDCLKFQYDFEENDVIDLSVFIKSGGLEEKKVWQMSRSKRNNWWHYARVPVKTTRAFNIIFEAKGSRNHSVYLDEIEYKKEECDIQPEDATPPPVTTSVVTSFTTTIESSTVPTVESSTTTSTSKSSTTVPTVESSSTDPQEHMSDSTQSGDAPTTSSQAGRTAPAESSSDIGLIVGVMVAVVLLLLLGLVLCILFRMKRSHGRKTCLGKQKQTEEDLQVRAAHNAVYSVDEAEPDRLNHVDINPVNPGSNAHQHEVSTTVLSSPANSYYDVVDATDAEPSENKYTELNKLKKTNNGKLQQNHQRSDESPYEIGDSSENITPIAEPPDDDYNKLNFHTRSHRNHYDRPAPSAEQNSDYSHLASKPKPPLSTARDGGPEVYQNSAKVFQASDQWAASALYQNVSQDADLDREDPSAALYNVPRGTASKSGPSINRDRGGGHTPSVSKSQDPGNGVYHVLQEETRDISEAAGNAEDYQHLDFDGNRVSEERDGDLPAPVYSHLNEGEGGHYQEIDRDRRREVIDGDYSHI